MPYVFIQHFYFDFAAGFPIKRGPYTLIFYPPDVPMGYVSNTCVQRLCI